MGATSWNATVPTPTAIGGARNVGQERFLHRRRPKRRCALVRKLVRHCSFLLRCSETSNFVLIIRCAHGSKRLPNGCYRCFGSAGAKHSRFFCINSAPSALWQPRYEVVTSQFFRMCSQTSSYVHGLQNRMESI